jgi:protein-disulfide isomerase
LNYFRQIILGVMGLFLIACGAYAPPAPTRSAVEERQTERAITGGASVTTDSERPTSVPRPTPDRTVLQARPDDPRALGDPNAPITIVEFSDFE